MSPPRARASPRDLRFTSLSTTASQSNRSAMNEHASKPSHPGMSDGRTTMPRRESTGPGMPTEMARGSASGMPSSFEEIVERLRHQFDHFAGAVADVYRRTVRLPSICLSGVVTAIWQLTMAMSATSTTPRRGLIVNACAGRPRAGWMRLPASTIRPARSSTWRWPSIVDRARPVDATISRRLTCRRSR